MLADTPRRCLMRGPRGPYPIPRSDFSLISISGLFVCCYWLNLEPLNQIKLVHVWHSLAIGSVSPQPTPQRQVPGVSSCLFSTLRS